MGLHVCVFSSKEPLHPVSRNVLRLIDELAAAVISFPGVSFGILVGQDAAEGLKHRKAHEILRRNELQLGVLTVNLALNGSKNVGVNALKVWHRHEVQRE